jgi:hypothetical protein
MTYSTVKRSLRPSRVAMVFDGGEFWSYRARCALHLANTIWGGAGFALVPHRDGAVNPLLLEAVRAYDPDFVVTVPRSGEDIVYLDQPYNSGALRGSREYVELLADALSARHLVPGDVQARDTVASVCSPYFQSRDDVQRESTRSFPEASMDFPRASTVPGAETGHVLSCPPNWGGVIGAAVAAHAGVVEPPNPAAAEPDLDPTAIARLTQWLIGGSSAELPMELVWFPTVATSIFPHEAPLAHQRTLAGLRSIYQGFTGTQALVVIGDSVDDFALAHLWKLTHGLGVWLPSALGTDDAITPRGLKSGLAELFDKLLAWPGSALFTSLSRTADDVRAVHDNLAAGARAGEIASDDPFSRPIPAADLPWSRAYTSYLAIDHQVDDVLTVPTVFDDNGTRSMVTPLPSATLTDPYLAAHVDLSWHIDLTWQPRIGVLGRNLPSKSLFSETTSPWQRLTAARSSRQGISHQSRGLDFYIGRGKQMNRGPRLAFKDLSLPDWVAAKARQHGQSTLIKGPGRRTAQLERMLGGRAPFLELFAGPLLPALRAFQAPGPSSRRAYPAGDGVRIRAGEGVLSFAGICARSGSLGPGEVRDRLDSALRAGVLVRGLVLRCPTCEEVQFQALDRLRQRWDCARCEAINDLNRPSWKDPIGEPTWFYDLHPIARRLLEDNGEISALLAARLRKRQTYCDLAEVTFVEDGKPRAEIDLIAYRDDTLIVAECKSSDHLDGTRKQMKAEVIKKCRIASMLQADLLIFATAAAEWQTATRTAIIDALQEFEWSAIGAPDLEFIENLGIPAGDNDG